MKQLATLAALATFALVMGTGSGCARPEPQRQTADNCVPEPPPFQSHPGFPQRLQRFFGCEVRVAA